MKYRSRTDIICSILETAMNGATKTRLMYGAYLSYYQIEEYLQLLTSRRLIEKDTSSSMYRLTQKGLDFLHKFNEMNELMSATEETQQSPRQQKVARTV